MNGFFSVSMDGSAFDSNQHIENIRAVDFVFYDAYKPRLKKLVERLLINLDLPL